MLAFAPAGVNTSFAMNRAPLAYCFLAAVLLPACSAPDIDYSQLPDLVRLITDPPGADVQLEGYVKRFVTPCDISREALRGRKLTITKEGYLPFHGSLGDITAGERGSFRLVLRKL